MCTVGRNGTDESNARGKPRKKEMSNEKEIEEKKPFYNIREELKRIEAKEEKKG